MRIKYLINENSRFESFNLFIKEKFPKLIEEENPELILVAGGDGSLLHGIQKCQQMNVPFLGKAMGTVNFLMNKLQDDEKVINKLLNDEIKLNFIETKSISVYTICDEESVYLGEAVNDVIIGNSIMGYHEFNISSTDQTFDSFKVRGTGLCISSPLGSTAYNFNNNGHILPLNADIWSVSGIVCNRYINDIVNQQQIEIESSCKEIFIDNIRKVSSCLSDDEESDDKVKLQLSIGKPIKIAFLNKASFMRRRVEQANRLRR